MTGSEGNRALEEIAVTEETIKEAKTAGAGTVAVMVSETDHPAGTADLKVLMRQIKRRPKTSSTISE